LIPKSNYNNYSETFKMDVVDDYFHNGLSYRDLALKYKVLSHNTIRNWIKHYTDVKRIRVILQYPRCI